MLPFEDRYTRQRQLPEIGAEGQRRIAESVASLDSSAAAQIAREYLSRAGVQRFSNVDSQGSDFAHAEHFCFSEARDFGRGTALALQHLRVAVDISED